MLFYRCVCSECYLDTNVPRITLPNATLNIYCTVKDLQLLTQHSISQLTSFTTLIRNDQWPHSHEPVWNAFTNHCRVARCPSESAVVHTHKWLERWLRSVSHDILYQFDANKTISVRVWPLSYTGHHLLIILPVNYQRYGSCQRAVTAKTLHNL